MIRISVVVPHLDAQEGLERCLNALADQREPPRFEVIVVDNGSRHRPVALCERFPFVDLIDERTRGPGPARSTGARAARGEVLAFVDADCWPDSDWLSTIDRLARASTVMAGAVRVEPVDQDAPTDVESYEAVFGYRNAWYARLGFAATCNMAVDRQAFLQVGPFGGVDIAEDRDWGRRATRLGLQVVAAPEVRVSTRARPDLDALCRKWDRHVAHDYAEIGGGPVARLRWMARATALAVSPARDVVQIIRSDLPGTRARVGALRCLVRIRWHRARTMASLGHRGDGAAMEYVRTWG